MYEDVKIDQLVLNRLLVSTTLLSDVSEFSIVLPLVFVFDSWLGVKDWLKSRPGVYCINDL